MPGEMQQFDSPSGNLKFIDFIGSSCPGLRPPP
jgi:hypothetical protein